MCHCDEIWDPRVLVGIFHRHKNKTYSANGQTILEVEVQCVDNRECPESRSSRRSNFVDLKLDRACKDGGPELVVHRVSLV